MHRLIPFAEASQALDVSLGGKAMMLARLQQKGFTVPCGYCLPTSVYHEYLAATGSEYGRHDH